MTNKKEGQTMPSPSTPNPKPPEVFFLQEMQKRLKEFDPLTEDKLEPQDQRLLMALAVQLKPDWDSSQYDAAAQLFYDYTSALNFLGENTREIGYLPSIASRLFIEPKLAFTRGMLLEHLTYLVTLKADAHP